MKKLHQQGFTIVEGLLLFVIVAIIGGTGYYVYSRVINDDSSQPSGDTTQKNTTSTESQTATDETADWLVFEAPNKQFKTKLADGWKLTQFNGSPYLYDFSNELAIVPGQRAVIENATGGRDFATAFYIGYVSNEEMVNLGSQRGTKEKSLKTNDGREVEVYHFTQTNKEPMLDVPYNGQEYTYIIRGSNGVVRVVYSFGPDETDYHKEVERILPSIQLQ